MKKTKGGYYRNHHCCFLLQYHLVLVTKYRYPIITGEMEAFLKTYLKDYFEKQDLRLISLEVMSEHIHLVFEAPLQCDISNVVNALKSASSRVVRKRFPDVIHQHYNKAHFWSSTYFIGTVSEQTAEVINHYISNLKKENSHDAFTPNKP